ncbi:putative thymidylate kinase [Paratrimastix pyriformis]|uniref:dTMP kinase n=1 Tax=Paratrimastix pyriformis TaxID=342808 RepID=A0ABQ8UIZ2_9EUKA|nr:putative thymidylate kinase [Paratrimastix pyriformis]
MSSTRGLFIVFEGLDRCGKSTQSDLLITFLRQQHGEDKAIKINFPDRETQTGRQIDMFLQKKQNFTPTEIHELYSRNRWEKRDFIVAALERGTTVICDRYAFSGTAYSVAQGLDMAWCMSTDSGLPCPDIVFFLDVPPHVAAARKGYGEERFEKTQFQCHVHEAFERLRDTITPAPGQHFRPVMTPASTTPSLPRPPPADARHPVLWVTVDGVLPPSGLQEWVRTWVSEAIRADQWRHRTELVLRWGPNPLQGLPDSAARS